MGILRLYTRRSKEGQNPIREVLARSSWRAGPHQEASDGSKVKRVGKLGPFISCEVWAQTKPAQATTPAVECRRRSPTTSVGAQATSPPGQERLCLGDNVYTRATTSTSGRQCLPRAFMTCKTDFSQSFGLSPVQMSAFGQQRLRSGDDVCCVRL